MISRIFSSVHTTVWKFQNFYATQILREIKVGYSEASKTAILIYFEALNFDFHEFLHFVQDENCQKIKTQILQSCKKGLFFRISRISKIDFT